MSAFHPPFIPASRREMEAAGFDELDILLITGDCYVDHPSFGVAVIGRLLLEAGWRVGIIAQPDWKDPESLKILGAPRVGIGVSAGNMDSMVNIYTAGRRFRRDDAFSENGETGKRPPHALTVYCQLAKQAFPGVPILAGGLEASMRRVAHYDYWQDKLRPSVLLDSKADILVYGMGEHPTPEAFRRMAAHESLAGIRGTARLLGKKAAEEFDAANYVELPSFEAMRNDIDLIMTETKLIEAEMNPLCGRGMIQRHGDRLLVVEPPAEPLKPAELDMVHELPYARRPHPMYKGKIPAFETIRTSIQAVRGCPGGCSFCGLVVHQGRSIMCRSAESILREAERIAADPDFKGTISDVGGAAGNLWGSVSDPKICSKCRRTSCLHPNFCPNYRCDGKGLIELLRKLRKLPKVKHVHINSGIRLDLALRQPELLKEIVRHHVSGHMKVAPEHLDAHVLELMRKGRPEDFFKIEKEFNRLSRECGKEQYLVPLFISNFPGCTAENMRAVEEFLDRRHWSLQQVQDYIPLPMTMGAAMYCCGKDFNGNPIPVNRGLAERRPQIEVLKKRRSGPPPRRGAPPPRRKERRR